jgi:hypothetical protein
MANDSEERPAAGVSPRDPATEYYACPRDLTHPAHEGPCPNSEGDAAALDAAAWTGTGVGVLVAIQRELATLNVSVRALVQFAAIIAGDTPQTHRLTAPGAVARAAKEIREENADARPDH